MASNTPNLNLLKKDPVTDGNDTFNIRTMLNENWDKIDAAVGEVREELQDIEIPDASLTQAGIVQLSNEINGSRENVAATEKAVSRAFQAGNERKAEVVAALVALGVPASTTETWAQLIPKMETIVRATGDATAADLLAGKKASNAGGPFTGTMPNQGAAIITPSGTGAVTIPDGAYKGAKVAQVSVPAAKVLNDTTIAGVTGSMANQGAKTSTITTQGGQYAIPAGYHNGSGRITASFANLVAGNVRNGVNIGGVAGTLQPGGVATLSLSDTNVLAPVGDSFKDLITFPQGVKRILFYSTMQYGSNNSNTSFRTYNVDLTLNLLFGSAAAFETGGGNIRLFSAIINTTINVWAIEINLETRTYTATYRRTGDGGGEAYSLVYDLPTAFNVDALLTLRFGMRNLGPTPALYHAIMSGTVLYV